MTVTPISEFFTAGGTLPPDAPSYVKRPTDDELFRNIKAGEFCYVLTPRQMGKSSLMIRTARRLMDEEVKSAIVDLTQIGTVESEDQWYKGILSQIRRRLHMSLDPVQWWEQKRDIPNIQKFIEFFEEALLEIREHVVIFMDEIDTTLKLDFRDNFFAGIRALYNARAENPDLRRLTFVLLGVASPSDLIKDRSRTPFNIGQEILLKPFSREDARRLEQGLETVYPGLGQQILNRVFFWTNGHPYLTQKICQSVVDEPLPVYEDGEIDRLVDQLFISEEASRETNLQFVRDSVLNHPDRKQVLSLYKKVLHGKEVRDNKNSIHQNHLKLAGLVRVDNEGWLVVSNRIYARVFDLGWIGRHMEVNWSRRISIALGLLVVLLAVVIIHDAYYIPGNAQEDLDNLTIYKDDRAIHSLARLFEMRPWIFPNENPYKAKSTFFNTFTYEDQIALVEIDPYTEMKPTNPREFKIAIAGLYTSLADVDRSGQTTGLLEVMKSSLEVLGLQQDPLYSEISIWLEARSLARPLAEKDALIQAEQNYSEAIGINPKNPATQFERARVYAALGDFASALEDYESVLGIVPESEIEPTAGPAPTETVDAAQTDHAIEIGSVVPPEGTRAMPQATKTPPATEITAEPMATPTDVAPAPAPSPILPRFVFREQRITAVKDDIVLNAGLYAFFLQAEPGIFPNLVENIPILLTTAAPTTAVPPATTAPPTTVAPPTTAAPVKPPLSFAEDCLPFNTNNVTLKESGDGWYITDGISSMLYFGANQSEAQQALAIIQHYGMNNHCFVGRPDASLEYWLVNGASPAGFFSGEDCISFNPNNIEVVNINGRWKIVEGNNWLLDFAGIEDEARKSYDILQHYGFSSICFVGRPDPSMIYFRR